MKYRVNLYREREERAIRFRRGLVRGVVLGTVVGVEVLLIGALLVAGQQMQSRADRLEMTLSAMEARIGPKLDDQELQHLRALVRSRLTRVDWASTLSAVAEAAPAGVVLTEIRGGIGGERGRMNGIELEGRLMGSSRDLSVVFEFIEALKADSTLARTFPVVDLGTAKGQGNSFQINCRPAEGENPS